MFHCTPASAAPKSARSFKKHWLRSCLAVLALMGLSLHAVPASEAPLRGVYVGNEFYLPSPEQQTRAHNSNFTALFLFTLHVADNGDISYNDTPVVSNGVYIGKPGWRAALNGCRGGSVNRIEAAIGCWGDQSFNRIKTLITSKGTGQGSILYRNFQAFKDATGVDAIQFDDEVTYDLNSMAAFGKMLSAIGFKVTLCPYTNQGFWANVLTRIGKSRVDAVYLQCYEGGAGNDPIAWSNALRFKVYPGLWGNTDTTETATAKMKTWQKKLGTQGGFMWLNGSMPGDASKWGQALLDGLKPATPGGNF